MIGADDRWEVAPRTNLPTSFAPRASRLCCAVLDAIADDPDTSVDESIEQLKRAAQTVSQKSPAFSTI